MHKNIAVVLFVLLVAIESRAGSDFGQLFNGEEFTDHDAVLISDDAGEVLFSWQINKPLIPASLVKLATASLAIKKWRLSHQFATDFYYENETLWVKGHGDPYLVSEELDVIVNKLRSLGIQGVKQINIDNDYFDISSVPGRTRVTDPYNAPLSAVSANFNTAKLTRRQGQLESAEPQTPLTPTAKRVGKSLEQGTDRINLVDSDNAQQNSDVAGGLNFEHASLFAHKALSSQFKWDNYAIVDGAGLSRDNRLSAKHINDLLITLKPYKTLFNKIRAKKKTHNEVDIYAKTGTLNGVRSYAGFIDIADRSYHFVFNFNRRVPYRYRDQLLERLLHFLDKSNREN